MLPKTTTPPIRRACEHCQAEFFTHPSRIKIGWGRFCSTSCSAQFRELHTTRIRSLVDRICETCGKNFGIVPSKLAIGWGKFCSRPCKDAAWRIPHEEQLRCNVDRSGGIDTCWPWTAGVDSHGYGVFGTPQTKSHRAAWEIANSRKIPNGLLVRHLCHNPPCCNPIHLAVGTHRDNKHDSVRAGRHAAGERQSRAKLNDGAVREARELRTTGITWSALARHFGVSPGTIRAAVVRKRWSHVE